MTNIKYLVGDALLPVGDDNKLIIHIVNDIGKFGSGFAKAIMQKYPKVREEYIKKYSKNELELGSVHFIDINDKLSFGNMVGQHGIISSENPTPIKYDAIKRCLQAVRIYALKRQVSIHSCRFGTMRAGGKWSYIEPIINEEVCKYNISVTIYDLKNEE